MNDLDRIENLARRALETGGVDVVGELAGSVLGLVDFLRDQASSRQPTEGPPVDHEAALRAAKAWSEGAGLGVGALGNLARCYRALADEVARLQEALSEARADAEREWVFPCKEWCGCLACTNGPYQKETT
jgi:hypothetical protein